MSLHKVRFFILSSQKIESIRESHQTMTKMGNKMRPMVYQKALISLNLNVERIHQHLPKKNLKLQKWEIK